jgi:hypothetical protein
LTPILTSWLFVFSLGLFTPIEHTVLALLYSTPVLVLPLVAHYSVGDMADHIACGKMGRALFNPDYYSVEQEEADNMILCAWVIARAISNIIAAAAPILVLWCLWSTI